MNMWTVVQDVMLILTGGAWMWVALDVTRFVKLRMRKKQLQYRWQEQEHRGSDPLLKPHFSINQYGQISPEVWQEYLRELSKSGAWTVPFSRSQQDSSDTPE